MKRKKQYNNIKRKIFQLLGNKCSHCSFSDERTFQIDHVFGQGNKDRKQYNISVYYKNVLRKIESGSTEYQLLCANCNLIKMHENKERFIGRQKVS